MGIEPIKPGFKGGAARLSPSERHHFNSRRPLNSPENSPDALVLTATLLCLIIDTSLGKKDQIRNRPNAVPQQDSSNDCDAEIAAVFDCIVAYRSPHHSGHPSIDAERIPIAGFD